MAKAAYPTIGIAALVMFGIVYFIGCLPTDLSNDRTVENGSTAPNNTSRALPSINQRTTDYVFPQPLAEEESQPLVLAE